MGTATHRRQRRKTAKNKRYKKNRDLKRANNFLDQRKKAIDLKDAKIAAGEEIKKPAFDEDLPGGGQNYCLETDRHFITAQALAAHKRSKKFRRAVKQLSEKIYTQAEADAAAGKTRESHLASAPK